MTITPTQLGSTSILDNHKPPDSYSYVMDEQDGTCSQYKPLLDRTKDYNSDTQESCEIPLSGITPIPPPTPWTPPWFPVPPPTLKSPLWLPSSTSPNDERGDNAVQNELASPNDTSEFGICQGHSSPCAPRPSRIQHLSPN